MKILRQVIYDIRQQPVVSWISVGGTALAIFLIMVIYMVNSLGSVEAPPELKRSRIFYGTGMHVGNNSSYLSLEYAQRIYGRLKGVEKVSYIAIESKTADVRMGSGESVQAMQMGTDQNFWDIYDFKFVEGAPYDSTDCVSGVRKVVITSRLAEKIAGKGEKIAGKEIMLDLVPYTVAGVVSNANPIMAESYSDIYLPFSGIRDREYFGSYPWFGKVKAHLLVAPGVDPETLREQVKRIYSAINSETTKTGDGEAIYHGQPYDAATMAAGGFGTNNTPQTELETRRKWVSYLVLLLLPAINLSAMTRSRMRRRIAEIGVRRAFGAKRYQIVGQLLAENFMLTLGGGIIGLILSILFTLNFSQYIMGMVNVWDASFEQLTTPPGFDMLFKWKTFFVALFFCLILNLVSAGIPAGRASRVNPAEALGSQGK